MTTKDESGRVLAVVMEQIGATVVLRATGGTIKAMVSSSDYSNTIELASRQPTQAVIRGCLCLWLSKHKVNASCFCFIGDES